MYHFSLYKIMDNDAIHDDDDDDESKNEDIECY